MKQELLNELYNTQIKSIYFDFHHDSIKILLNNIEGDKARVIELDFINVLKYKVVKDSEGDSWEVVSVAEIFNLKEMGEELGLNECDYQDYNYLIDGDGFEIFINAGKLELKEK